MTCACLVNTLLMPLTTTLRKLLCCTAGMQQEEEAEAPARRAARAEPAPAGPGPAQAGPAPAGRPYRDYVENETDRYWREMVKPGSLPKPDRQEIRASAFRTRGMVLRRRRCKVPDPALSRYRAHQAVNAVQLHLVEIRLLRHPFAPSEASPGYAEALVQLVADAGWQPREIPLPAHPDPQHPAIFYYIDDPVSERPVPREDALIRADYVRDAADGCRITGGEYIYPWRGPAYQPSIHDICSRGRRAYYTLSLSVTGSRDRSRDLSPGEATITYHWIEPLRGIPVVMRKRDRVLYSTPFGDRVLMSLHFSPRPPSPAEIFRLRRTRDQLMFEMLAAT